MTDFDCLVIGAGPGGYVAAIRAAQLGLRTAIVERMPAPGGRCLHEACIPAKTVLRSAEALWDTRHAARFGVDVGATSLDFAVVCERRRAVIDGLARGVGGLLRKNGIELLAGSARLAGGPSVVFGERTVAAGAVILATGSKARALPAVPFGGRVIGTEQAWALESLPASMAIIGAGASGVELASAYGRLGVRVELIEVAEQILPTEEPEISAVVEAALAGQGVTVRTSAAIQAVSAHDDHVVIATDGGAVEVEWVVLAVGRAPDVESLGLDQLGVGRSGDGLIEVDHQLRTSVAGVFAIGDLVRGPALAHKASHEGVIAAESIAGLPTEPLDLEGIPRVTFCLPNVASVGITEATARRRGLEVAVGRVPYRSVGASTVSGAEEGLVKLVGDRASGAILGVHLVGARSVDLIQQGADAMALEGGYDELARVVHAHPTMSEGLQEAARAAAGWVIHG